jgi:mycofactocin glycosyltransferase
VRDRAAELDRCLTALSGGGPVVVVDDGSADPAAVSAVAHRHGARVICRPNGGPAAARNTGLAHVETPVVALLDSDCRPPGDWIERLIGHLDDPLVVAVAPRIVAAGDGPRTWAGRFASARPVLDLGPRPARVQPMTRVSYVPTAALLIRTEAARFDESLRYGEDVDLIWRLLEQGHRVRYDPRVTVGHEEPHGWPALLRRRYAYGTSAAGLEVRHPGRVAPLVLVAAPTAVVVAVLARRPGWAVAAFAAGYADIALARRASGLPVTGIARPLATGIRETFVGSGRWVLQFALPLALAGALPRARRLVTLVTLAAWIGAAPVREWVRARPPLGLVPYVAGVLADDAAYGAGVWAGSLRHRHVRALIPRGRLRLTGAGRGG